VIQVSEAAAMAITAPEREITVRAKLDLIDPDIVIVGASSSAGASWSNSAQIFNREVSSAAAVASFEVRHFPLDGGAIVPPEFSEPAASVPEVGFVSAETGDGDGVFSGVWCELDVSGVGMLSACSVWFPETELDGYAVDFLVEIFSGQTLVHSETIAGNSSPWVRLGGFRVYNATAVRVYPLRWSKPHTRARVIEITAGLFEEWDASNIYSAEVLRETDFTMLTMPYSTATIVIDNSDRRFDPRNKEGVFSMLEARQSVPLFFGVRLGAGVEWVPAGVWFLQNSGWETERNGLLMRFNLTDLIGLLRDRRFRPPEVLPVTLAGWVAAIAGQLGGKLADMYEVDGDVAGVELVCEAADVSEITCGTLLRFACMAAGADVFTDSATGFLSVRRAGGAAGVTYTAGQMSEWPKQTANYDVAMVIFKLHDEARSTFYVNGNNSSSALTITIDNFFVKSQVAASVIARRILGNYGGQVYEFRGRGDLRSELGDVDLIQMYGDVPAVGRRRRHQLSLNSRKVMRDALSVLEQPTGEEIYTSTVVIRQDGVWTAPPGVTTIRVTLIGGGQGGRGGWGGYGGNGHPWAPALSSDGAGGEGGAPGLVWTQVLEINPEQSFTVVVGRGGAGGAGGAAGAFASLYDIHGGQGGEGARGSATLFGPYSSADGQAVSDVVDIVSGLSYAAAGGAGRSAQDYPTSALPAAGSGDGGAGGDGGAAAIWRIEGSFDSSWREYKIKAPVAGASGGRGAGGVVLIAYAAV
jgi:hypothetical protein